MVQVIEFTHTSGGHTYEAEEKARLKRHTIMQKLFKTILFRHVPKMSLYSALAFRHICYIFGGHISEAEAML